MTSKTHVSWKQSVQTLLSSTSLHICLAKNLTYLSLCDSLTVSQMEIVCWMEVQQLAAGWLWLSYNLTPTTASWSEVATHRVVLRACNKMSLRPQQVQTLSKWSTNHICLNVHYGLYFQTASWQSGSSNDQRFGDSNPGSDCPHDCPYVEGQDTGP